MMDFGDALKKLATSVLPLAPTLATMLGGPLAGTAVAALAGAFGMSPTSTASDITQVMQTGAMTPETLAAVRAADQKHAEIMAQQNIDLAKLNAAHDEAYAQDAVADRDSARKMQIAQPSVMPAVLTVLLTFGFFGVLAAMLAGVHVQDNPVAMQMFGGLTAGWSASLAYWLGTTRGSNEKNALLAQSTPPQP